MGRKKKIRHKGKKKNSLRKKEERELKKLKYFKDYLQRGIQKNLQKLDREVNPELRTELYQKEENLQYRIRKVSRFIERLERRK